MHANTLARRLFHATESGDAVAVAQSLTDGADVDATNEHGETALMRAAARGHLPTIDVLLVARAAVDISGIGEWTALGYAVRRGHAAVVQSLVAAGANVECVNGQGDSALLCAIWSNHRDVVNVLLDLTPPINVNVVNKALESALVLACTSHQEDVVERLVKANADVNWALQRAVDTNDVIMLKRLLPWVKNIKHIGSRGEHNSFFQPLFVASEKGNAEIVRRLLEAGADVNATSYVGTALTIASAMGHREIVEMLLAADGIDVDYQKEMDSDPPLMRAAWFGHADIVAMLVAAGANVHYQNRHHRTALIQAVVRNKLDIAETLIDCGVTVDQLCDERRWKALSYATSASNAAVLEALLAKGGADVNYRNVYGMSALHNIDFDGRPVWKTFYRGTNCGTIPQANPDCSLTAHVDTLLAHGADIDHISADGTTPLMKACDFSRAEIVACLLAAGADPWLTDSDGDSALQRAAKVGNVAIVEMLIVSGVDVNHMNYDRRSALMVAANYGHGPVVDALLRAGANAAVVDARNHSAITAVRAGLLRLQSDNDMDPNHDTRLNDAIED